MGKEWNEQTVKERKQFVKQTTAYRPSWLSDDTIHLYKIRAGMNKIRIVPPLKSDEHKNAYGMQITRHFLHKREVISIKSIDSSANDPLLNYKNEIKRIGDEATLKLLSGVGQTRMLMYVLDMHQDNPTPHKVYLWAAPYTLYSNILSLTQDDSGNFYPVEHHKNGCLISFMKKGQKINTRYDAVQLYRDKVLKLGDKHLEQINEFKDIIHFSTDAEMEELLKQFKKEYGIVDSSTDNQEETVAEEVESDDASGWGDDEGTGDDEIPF